MSSLPWTEDEMTIGIDLYRSDDYVKVGRVGLVALLREVFEKVLGQDLADARFILLLHPIEDGTALDGEPSLANLRRSHGFINVRILRDGVQIYQHPHAVRELVGRPLQRLLAETVPDETHWGYGIAGPGLEHLSLVRPAPRPTGSVDVRSGKTGPRLFHVEVMPEPEPPEAALEDFGVPDTFGGADPGHDSVIFTPDVHQAMLKTMDLSADVEEGGFLVGRVYRHRGFPGRHITVISEALPAERTGASMLEFTFTGESFLRINDVISRRGPEFRLVGWYHTHLFAATDKLGLSSIDVELHSRVFQQPWQLAGLINLSNGTRTLRVYHWDGSAMHALPYQVGEP
jgi:hypothetical protein